MDLTIVISIIGGFLTVGLTINGFFLRGIVNGQNKLEVDIAKIMVKIDNFNGRIEELEHKVRKIEMATIECRTKCYESANLTV